MQIKNACLDIDKIDFETKKEEKELHGWGVKIIKEIVDEAQGTIQYIKEQNNRLKDNCFSTISVKKAADNVAGE